MRRDEHRSHPEISTVVSQLGRPDDGTDVVRLLQHRALRAAQAASTSGARGVTKEKLTEELSTRARRGASPASIFNFSQMISDNVEEAMSGVKGENTVKVIGPDLRVNEAKADEIVDVHGDGAAASRTSACSARSASPTCDHARPRSRAARYGLNVGDVEAVVQAAIGGQAVTQVYEGEKHFDLTVRWAPAVPQGPARPSATSWSPRPTAAQVPLGQLAQIVEEDGPVAHLPRGQPPLRAGEVLGARARSGVDHRRGAATKIERRRSSCPTTRTSSGRARSTSSTRRPARLVIIIPLTLLLIAFLVYSSVKNWNDMLIVLAGIPVRLRGRRARAARHRHELLDLGGDGLHLDLRHRHPGRAHRRTYAQRLWTEGADLEEGARLAAERGLRPVLMTTLRRDARPSARGALARHRLARRRSRWPSWSSAAR